MFCIHNVVPIGVRCWADKRKYSFKTRRQYEKLWVLIFQDFKVVVRGLVRTIPACQKMPTTRHWWVTFFVPNKGQSRYDTGYLYPFTQSSSHLSKLDSSLTLLPIRHQQSICWHVKNNLTISVKTVDNLSGSIMNEVSQMRARLLL